jgi:hypothetical protein
MYIISEIDEETFFRTNTRCEIGKIGLNSLYQMDIY